MTNQSSQPAQQIGLILRDKGVLSEDQLRIALFEQARHQQPLGKLLVSLGFVSEATLRDVLSASLGTACIDLAHALINPAALAFLPRELARRYHCLPLDYESTRAVLSIACPDVGDIITLDQIRRHLPPHVHLHPLLAGAGEIDRAIDQCYGHTLSIDGILHEIETGEAASTKLAEASQPVVRLVDALLHDAVKRGASDIHFEPEQGFLRIRYRIDGLLRQIRSLHHSYWPSMTVRLKIMSGMNIAEMRAPQDGRFSLRMGERLIDFRVSAQPTLYGENIVLRVLDRQKGLLELEQLDFSTEQMALLKRMMARPEGIILVTGPTGSGKTTTLYAMLKHINHEGIHIMTLEDPVEYPMMGVRQTSVTESARLDFANGIRSMMRQDPDVILVGEIRDADTADMALRAAMTGHQVYSTLHTNSALGAIARLMDIGLVPDILASNIIGIIAQRLVRCLCAQCKEGYCADEEAQRLLGLSAGEVAPHIYRARGCEACDFQGYRGRRAVLEIVRIDAALDALIATRRPQAELRQLAQAQGMKSLVDDGVARVLDGTTSLQELCRVVDLSARM